MANVKVFADKWMDKRTGEKKYVPDLSMRGHKNHLKATAINECDLNTPACTLTETGNLKKISMFKGM